MKCDECKGDLEFESFLVKGHDIEIEYCPSCDKIVGVEY